MVFIRYIIYHDSTHKYYYILKYIYNTKIQGKLKKKEKKNYLNIKKWLILLGGCRECYPPCPKSMMLCLPNPSWSTLVVNSSVDALVLVYFGYKGKTQSFS